MTDVTMVPPILMAGLRSASYKNKTSDRTLTGATLKLDILSQCGECTLRDSGPSCMNHGKGSVIGQLTPVEYNRLTEPDTVSIDEAAGGYMEMTEYRNSARGHLIALENKSVMKCYLEEMIQGTTMKQKAYRMLVSFEMRAEAVDQLVSLPWRAVILRHFEEERQTTPNIQALIEIPYVRTWSMTKLTMEEYNSEESKRSKEEKVLLRTSLRDLMIREGAAVSFAKRRVALCFFRFMLEQILVPALNNCAKQLREGSELAKTLLIQALLDIHQSKPMRVNMKEPLELEPLKKIDKIRRFSNTELRLTKESMGTLLKSCEYCGPIRKKSYHYGSGIVGMAYNPFSNEDIRDCYYDNEKMVLLRFWLSRFSTIRRLASQQIKMELVLEEKVTAPSIPMSDNRVEFGLGFSNELLRMNLMVVWELLKPSWCPSPNADYILRATHDVQKQPNTDCNLRDLIVIYKLMTTASRSNRENNVELPG